MNTNEHNWIIYWQFVLAAPSNGIFVGGLCSISPDICLRWELRACRRRLTKAKRRAPSVFGLITRLSRFIILPLASPRILSSNAASRLWQSVHNWIPFFTSSLSLQHLQQPDSSRVKIDNFYLLLKDRQDIEEWELYGSHQGLLLRKINKGPCVDWISYTRDSLWWPGIKLWTTTTTINTCELLPSSTTLNCELLWSMLRLQPHLCTALNCEV